MRSAASFRAVSRTWASSGRPAERMQHLRHAGAHPLALAGGEDRDVEGRGTGGRHVSTGFYANLAWRAPACRAPMHDGRVNARVLGDVAGGTKTRSPPAPFSRRNHDRICADFSAPWSPAFALVAVRAARLRRRRLQEPRRARHDVLRRQQGHGRRRADRPEEVEEPVDHRLHVHARRGSGGLREHLQAVHHASRGVPQQEGRVLPGAVERRRDRGDALGPPARRRLLDRPDGVRRQSRRRRAVRGQGLREGVPGLQPDRDRQGELAVPEALRPQGQEGRAHVAVVEFRPSRAAVAVPRAGAHARQGLQDHLLRQARPVGDGRQLRRLRRRRGRLRRLPSDGRARAGQGGRFPDHLPQPEIPDLVVRLRARSRSEARRQDARLLLRLPLPAGDAEGVRRRRPLLPDQLQDDVGSRARGGEGLRRRRSTRRPTRRNRRARRPRPRPRRNSRIDSQTGRAAPRFVLRPC